ncbi:unnamed protein product [Paramecium octaurelia]|uniref:EML-like second beta-propeller domain-containing protein n=1 Tax=Paramecium octaurelia TaxID=43137 RepID=A0A8S1YIM7_PAROT|nr:unnamed protein product [Paramecium octaurelia]
MNCTYHCRNQVSLICIAPHKCQCQRKLCTQCQYEHGVDLKYTVPIEIFEKMMKKKFEESYLNQKFELAQQRTNFESMLSSTQKKLQQVWDELAESIKQIYDMIEMEDKSFLKIINNNMHPTELSSMDLEKLIQIINGKTLDNWKDQKNSYLKRLERTQNVWKQEVEVFSNKIRKKMMSRFQSITEAAQVYNRKNDLYKVLSQIENIDESFLNETLEMFKRDKITDCLIYLSNKKYQEMKWRFIYDILKNISEIDFNIQNYSSENYAYIRKNLIKYISQNKQIIEFLKFLVHLTAIDQRFIQCGSNSINILVEMKVDFREQSFENIRIQSTSLIGGNFVKCNFNGSNFYNVDISGMNLNYAQLFNCKWKCIKIHKLNKFDGHVGCVRSVCFSPDGSTLASGSVDNSIGLWNTKTGQQKAKLYGHSNSIISVSFSPDGSTLASGSFDNSIGLWDVKTGEKKAKLYGHTNSILSVCFSPDGTILASGSDDKSIRLWDVKTGKQQAKLDGHTHYIRSVCFSPDGSTLASGSDDSSIRLWDVKTGQQKAKLDGHTSTVYSVCFSPDGSTLASGSQDHTIRLWEMKTGEQKIQFDDNLNSILSVCFQPDGSTLASGSVDNSIRLWDVKTGKLIIKLDGHQGFVYSVCFSPDGTKLASGSFDNSIRVWNVKKDLLIQLNMSLQSQFILFQICKNPVLQVQGTLILNSIIENTKGQDLQQLFKAQGSLILEDQMNFNNNQ